ncbi:MTBP [Branchiostoma lanceolatum]|uniref:MTBP protein n=1 Tax=Branchiostoma lanceolatum TaxID=7740 RepID=A0A8K0F0J0_BRALA|nr:MTBP [Branchiostoma lanceolatum]
MDQYFLLVHTGHPSDADLQVIQRDMLDLIRSLQTEQHPALQSWLQDCPNRVIQRVPCLHLAFVTSWEEHLSQEKNKRSSSSWHTLDKTHAEEEEEDSKRSWVQQVEQLMKCRWTPSQETRKYRDEDNKDFEAHMTNLANHIHGLADQLPGSDSFMLNVVWISSSEDVTLESHIQLLGALKRLHDWHHAHIRLVPTSSDKTTKMQLVRSLGNNASREESLSEALKCSLNPLHLWRGSVNVHESKGPQFLSLLGFSLECRTDPPSIGRIKTALISGKDNESTSVMTTEAEHHGSLELSQHLELVQVVQLEDVPRHLISPASLNLKLSEEHAKIQRSRTLYQEVAGNPKVGLLTRLTCTRTLLPLKPAKERSAQEWTDKFKNKPSDTAAPPVEVKGAVHDLHLLVVGDGEKGCMAHILYPPAQLNGAVLHRLATTDNRLLEDTKPDLTPVENMLCHLPDLTSGLVGMERDLLQLQVYALKMWTEEKTAAGQPPQLTYQEIVSVLSAAKEEYLKRRLGATNIARTHLSGKGLDFTDITCASELDLDSNMWPEKEALVNRETMEDIEKSMKRQKSVDILLGGLQPPKRMDNEIKLDAEEFIKHFLSNGMAAKDNLTPLQLPKKGKLRQQTKQSHNVEPEQMKATSFSDAVKTDLPGIEYCLDSKQAEDQDARISLIQSRYVSHETSSTCTVDKASSPATMVTRSATPKKQAGKHAGRRTTPRSQRSGSSRAVEKRKADGSLDREQSKRHASVSKTGLPQHVKRERTLSAPVSRRSRATPQTLRASSCTDSAQEDKDRGKSSTSRAATTEKGADSSGKQQNATEKRSDRHKRKLWQVVDEALTQNGVGKGHKKYKACCTRLFEICKMFLRDLKNSHKLEDHMKRLAEQNVKQVVGFYIE